MKKPKENKRSFFVTVGLKILVGVAVASNLFIGCFLYVNLEYSEEANHKVQEILAIREELSANLRDTVVGLQKELLAIPDHFESNPTAEIMRIVTQQYPIRSEEVLAGRDSYKTFYKRKERRDLAQQGKFIVQTSEDSLILSTGMFDEDGKFTDSVKRFVLDSNNPEQNVSGLQTLVNEKLGAAMSSKALERKVHELNARIADIGLEAENVRNEILYRVEDIRAREDVFSHLISDQKKNTIGIAVLAIAANMLVLFLLTRWIVERPLKVLTKTIDDIKANNIPEVPYQNRRDQIGVLSGAIRGFAEALGLLQIENQRKAQEKVVIDEMFTTVTSVVQNVEAKALEMEQTALNMEQLAETTEEQAGGVEQQAAKTAELTSTVSISTETLQAAFVQVSAAIDGQTSLVKSILQGNDTSREIMFALEKALKEIQQIITIVEDITDQTKLLALNATIEAVRAGDAGKGFGVVADEVKQLSIKTGEATSAILGKVEAIKSAGTALAEGFHSVEENMNNLASISGKIEKAVYEQKQATEEITEAANRTSDNTAIVSSSISEVRRAAQQTRSHAGDVHDFSSDLSTTLTNLLIDLNTKLEQLRSLADDPDKGEKHLGPNQSREFGVLPA